MQQIGYLKISRELMAAFEWLDKPNILSVMVHLLFNANWQDGNYRGIQIQRGQYVTTIDSLAKSIGLTPKATRYAMKCLEKSNEICVKGTNKFSIVTICKYDSWVDGITQEGQTKGKQRENEGQTKGKPIYINKNKENKENNKYNNISTKMKKPTIAEIQAYIMEKGYDVDALHFFDYYESNGWRVGKNPMKDWKAAVRTWARNQKPNHYGNTSATKEQQERDYIRNSAEFLASIDPKGSEH